MSNADYDDVDPSPQPERPAPDTTVGDKRLLGVKTPPKRPLPRVERDVFSTMRKLKDKRSLNDMVEEVLLTMVENEAFIALLEAVWDSEAIEGSLSADNYAAAEMLRDKARKLNSDVGNYKLATIAHSLNIVVKRYGMSRKERRYTVGGEFVHADQSNSNNVE